MVDYQEGQTATNPKTGQKIVYQGGLWVAAGGGNHQAQLKPQEQKTLQTVQDQAATALDTLPDINRFDQLEQNTATGGLAGWGPIAAVRGMFDPNVQQINEINARLTPAQRQPGSGTTSDRDLALFQQAVPGLNRTKAANDAILERGRREAVTRQQRADFYSQYSQQNGTLNGAEQAFRAQIGRGSQDNPYDLSQGQSRATLPRAAYYTDPQGNLRRNDNADFGNPIVRAGKRGAGPGVSFQPNEQQQKALTGLQGSGPRGAASNPVILNPTDPNSSYANMKSGQYFVGPDGQVRKKP